MSTGRGSRREALRDSVAPAFRMLVDEVIPARAGAQAVAAARGIPAGSPTRSTVAKWSGDLRYLNKVKDAGIRQPSATKAWEIAEFAEALDPERNGWCFGLVFVFAAGHLGEFARTMASTDEALVPRQRKFALSEAVKTAASPAADLGLRLLRERLAAAGVPDTVAQAEMRRARRRAAPPVRPDRNTWILTIEERAALRTAFLSPSAPLSRTYEIGIATARLAASAPELGVDMQRDITVTALCHAFGS